MNREDIIRMAREAGFHIVIDDLPGDQVRRSVKSVNTYCTDEIARFAKMVAANEREECAKMCEEHVNRPHLEFLDRRTPQECAAAIRARGKNADTGF